MKRYRLSPLRVVLLVGLLAIGAYGLIVTAQIIFPKQGAPRHSDAIVSLAPNLDRLPLAQRLFDADVADTLAISRPETGGERTEHASDSPPACDEDDEPGIICFTPLASDTLGEAEKVSELASAHNWKSVTVVTSRYHAFRTQFIFNQCLPDGVQAQVISSDTKLGLRGWLFHITYEHVAFVKALYDTGTRCR